MEIDRKRIEDWAKEYPAQAEFPLLIAKMVYATIKPGDHCFIPWGSAVNIGGWDGLVISEKGAGFIPAGRSIIEIGTNDDFKSKAENDYNTRTTSKGEVIDRSQTTFIFMTPRCWKGCEKWQEEKKNEKVWKDVRVYDSRGISSLLLSMESVSSWLARRIDLCPDSGVIDAERYWKEGILSYETTLNPRFFIAGRISQLAKLEELLSTEVPIVGVLASSKDEALEFILASGMSFTEDNQKRFKSKALVVTNVDALRRLPTDQGLIIIPTFEDARPLYLMAAHGNTVYIPLGADTDYQKDVIELTRPDKHELVSSLLECGIEEERAERIVRDSACSITAIKKDLGFFVQRAEWLNDENVTELLAALLCGRWNENYEGDRTVLSELSGIEFDQYKQKLEKWNRMPLSPVLQIGATWRLVSPLSLWTDLTKILPPDWEVVFKKVCEDVFVYSEIDHHYSPQLCDGLLHNMILIALYGQRIRIMNADQDYINGIVHKILENDTANQWNHVYSSLPLIAEASPDVFLSSVSNSLSNTGHPIMSLFNETEGIIVPNSHHVPLLWALEGLAWVPEYLKKSAELLFELSDLDPGGKLANRPYNSLKDIFNPWVPQTTADYESRLVILKSCVKKKYECVWNLLLSLLPSVGFSVLETHKLKWRKFDYDVIQDKKVNTSFKFTEVIVEMLMESYDGSDSKMAELLRHIETIPPLIRKKLISWIGISIDDFKGTAPETTKALREALWYNGVRSRNLKLDEEEISTINKSYEKLLSNDIIKRFLWLFDESFPHLPNPNDDLRDIDKSHEECQRQRKETCQLWLNELGVKRTVELRFNVGEPATLGNTLADFCEPQELYSIVLSLISNESDASFVHSYLSEKERIIGEASMIELYKSFAKNNNDVDDNVAFLLCLRQTVTLWGLIELKPQVIQTNYWQKVNVLFWGDDNERILYAIEKLIENGRALTALNGSWHHAEKLSTMMLQTVLLEALRCSVELNGTIDYLSAERYLEELHKRNDRDDSKLELIEWLYLPIMIHHPQKANVELLINKLNNNPNFFAEVLSYLYIPDEGKIDEGIKDDESELKVKKANAERAYELFDQWNKIPGVDENGVVDTQVLKGWLEKAIVAARRYNREKSSYIQLGKLFAQYPEDSSYWPSMELFSIMETMSDESFYRNYENEMFNKRGFTTRGPYDGGDIERDNAEYFKGLYKFCFVTCPRVAKVFDSLAKQYESMAKERDNEADIDKLDY